MVEDVSKELKADSEEAAELPKIESNEDLARIVQALVFCVSGCGDPQKLKEIIGDFLDSKTVAEALRLANDSLNRMDSPFENCGTGWRLPLSYPRPILSVGSQIVSGCKFAPTFAGRFGNAFDCRV